MLLNILSETKNVFVLNNVKLFYNKSKIKYSSNDFQMKQQSYTQYIVNQQILPKIKMSMLQNWSHVVLNVQHANLDKQTIEAKIIGLNKRAYKEELDREIQLKNYQYSLKNQLKGKQLQQAKYLAESQRKAKIQSKQYKQQMQRHYGEQNQELIKLQNNIKATSKEIERKNIKQFLEHPFIKLVDDQDNRNKQLRKKFIKQNQINHLQEEMRNQQRQAIKYRQMQQKNQFINYIETTHQKRSAQRQRFKNKYLRVRKSELDSNTSSNLKQEQSVQKMYVSYLNNQMKSDNQKKINQKSQKFEDKRIQQFYHSNHIEPDSSPAFLGRNPLTYERQRQLFFINKHLNTHHQRSLTSNSQLNSKTNFVLNALLKEQSRSNQYLKDAEKFNPEEEQKFIRKVVNYPINQNLRINQNHSVQIKPYLAGSQLKNETKSFQRQRSFDERQSSNIYSNTKNTRNPSIICNRRIKSQLTEGFNESPQKLPSLSKKILEHQLQNKNMNNSTKKQYFRYDVITGKQIVVYL